MIAFTGTRKGMTYRQKQELHEWLEAQAEHERVFGHGDCVGSDAEAAEVARQLGYRIIGYPPSNYKQRAWVACDALRPEASYHVRNHNMVDDSTILLATPGSSVESFRGSGTWSTMRYARKIGKPVEVFWP